MTAPSTKYDGDSRVVWDGMNGWDVTTPGGQAAHVELWVGGEAESWFTSHLGEGTDRQMHPDADTALRHLLGDPQ